MANYYINHVEGRAKAEEDILPIIVNKINTIREGLDLSPEDNVDFINIKCVALDKPTDEEINIDEWEQHKAVVSYYVYNIPSVNVNAQSGKVLQIIDDAYYSYGTHFDVNQTDIDFIIFDFPCEYYIEFGYSDFR